MPIITKIEVQKNNPNRANVYIEDKFYGGLSLSVVIKNHLKKDMEITIEQLDKVVLADEQEKAFEKATNYLSRGLKTTKQIRDYLYKKEFNSTTISHVIEKLKEYKYLDDEYYAKVFVLTFSKKYGKLKLKSGLFSKGIDKGIIDNLFDDEPEMVDSIQLVAEKYLKNKVLDEQTLIKLNRFLYTRGYEFDEIKNLIATLKGDISR